MKWKDGGGHLPPFVGRLIKLVQENIYLKNIYWIAPLSLLMGLFLIIIASRPK
jgi:hypothetical protein